MLNFDEIVESSQYDRAQESNSKRIQAIEKDLKKRLGKNWNPSSVLPVNENEKESDDLECQADKIFIPANTNDISAKLEVLPGLRHAVTLTEASSLKDELNKRGERETEQQYQKALENICTRWMELPGRLLEQIAINTRTKTEEQKVFISTITN